MVPDIKKEQLNWIKANRTLALIIVQMLAIGFLVNHTWSIYEANIAEKKQQIQDLKDVIKIYREATMRAAEIEKQSQILKYDR